MKGVSEIIAIIMILMIVIALSALAYTWFSGIFSELISVAGTSLTRSSKSMATQFTIESATYNASAGTVYVSVRNTGTQGFNATRSLFYVRDSPGAFSYIDCQSCNCNDLAQGCVANFNIPSAPFGAISAGSKIMITIDTGLQSERELAFTS